MFAFPEPQFLNHRTMMRILGEERNPKSIPVIRGIYGTDRVMEGGGTRARYVLLHYCSGSAFQAIRSVPLHYLHSTEIKAGGDTLHHRSRRKASTTSPSISIHYGAAGGWEEGTTSSGKQLNGVAENLKTKRQNQRRNSLYLFSDRQREDSTRTSAASAEEWLSTGLDKLTICCYSSRSWISSSSSVPAKISETTRWRHVAVK